MKLFKHFTYSEIKEISNKLESKNCYFRHPKEDFVKYLGQETVNKLVDIKFLKDSPHIEFVQDYSEDCYEFTKKFKRIYNFIITPFFIWVKFYVLKFGWFKYKWQQFRIACGHHYDWQDYEGIDLDEI